MVAALLRAQVPISTIARPMIYAVKCCLESGDPSDSLASVEAEACKRPHSSRETLKAFLLELLWLIFLRTTYIIKTWKAFQPRSEAMIEAVYQRPFCIACSIIKRLTDLSMSVTSLQGCNCLLFSRISINSDLILVF